MVPVTLFFGKNQALAGPTPAPRPCVKPVCDNSRCYYYSVNARCSWNISRCSTSDLSDRLIALGNIRRRNRVGSIPTQYKMINLAHVGVLHPHGRGSNYHLRDTALILDLPSMSVAWGS